MRSSRARVPGLESMAVFEFRVIGVVILAICGGLLTTGVCVSFIMVLCSVEMSEIGLIRKKLLEFSPLMICTTARIGSASKPIATT